MKPQRQTLAVSLQLASPITIQHQLGRALLWSACRHHVGEIIFTHVFQDLRTEPSKSPEVTLFSKFRKHLDHISPVLHQLHWLPVRPLQGGQVHPPLVVWHFAVIPTLFHGQERDLATEPSLWPVQLYGTVYQQQFVKLTACIGSDASSKRTCLLCVLMTD